MISAIIQARLGSTRLPGKTLQILNDKSLIEHIIDRVSHSKFIEQIIVATTTSKIDDKLVSFLKENTSIKIYRGDEENVLDRYYQASKSFGVTTIVRVTADDPFKDPEIIDKVIKFYLDNPIYDYVSNTLKPTYPDGLDVEVFSTAVLKVAWKEGLLPSEKEHVTPYIWKNPKRFKVHNYENTEDFSSYRWTIDYPEDLEFARKVYDYFKKSNKIFLMRDILKLISLKPELNNINQNISRNIGYVESLKQDKKILNLTEKK